MSTPKRKEAHEHCIAPRADHLVYTAGETLTLGPIGEIDLNAARRALDTRMWGAYAAVKHGHAHIRPGGSIVLSSGSAGARPQANWSIGASICGAIESLTRALAIELAPIRVNAVAPGVVRTDLWRDLSDHERQELYDGVGASLLVGRVGDPDEIAQAFAFLMHNGYSSGTVLASTVAPCWSDPSRPGARRDPRSAMPRPTRRRKRRPDPCLSYEDRAACLSSSSKLLASRSISRSIDFSARVNALSSCSATRD
jgi:hypothetical protein